MTAALRGGGSLFLAAVNEKGRFSPTLSFTEIQPGIWTKPFIPFTVIQPKIWS